MGYNDRCISLCTSMVSAEQGASLSRPLQLQRLYYPQSWPPMPGCAYLPVTKSVVICAGDSYFSNDFFNAIFLHTWSVSAADLVLNFSYASQGSVLVDVWHELPSGAPKCVDSRVLPACAEGETRSMEIALPTEMQHITRGYCYFRVIALEAACTISCVSWSSLQPLRRSPKLGLIITHFHREAEVQAFVDSIKGTAIAEMLSQDKLALIIVDNSQTLRLPIVNWMVSSLSQTPTMEARVGLPGECLKPKGLVVLTVCCWMMTPLSVKRASFGSGIGMRWLMKTPRSRRFCSSPKILSY